MKKLQNVGQSAQNSKEQFRILKAIRQLIKTKAYKSEAIIMLEAIDFEVLPKEGKVLFNYVWGRVHILQYKETENVEDLDTANNYLDDMTTTAYQLGIKISDPRMHYSRAYNKFRLAQLTWEDENKPWLLKKVKHITEVNLRFYPDNTSFLWLKSQLEA